MFDKLLPEPHNTSVMTLLFLLCHWHGLAKLCMHTDDILRLMESITVKLGNHLHTFTNETCSAFSTKELRCEAEARTRCQGRETLQKLGNASSWQNDAQAPTRKAKTLNLQTYKLHALGDYPEQMQTYSTTDSYSMQPVSYLCLLIYLSLIFPPQGELEHCIGKNRFAHTSWKMFIPQLASIEQRQTHPLHLIQVGWFPSRAQGDPPRKPGRSPPHWPHSKFSRRPLAVRQEELRWSSN